MLFTSLDTVSSMPVYQVLAVAGILATSGKSVPFGNVCSRLLLGCRTCFPAAAWCCFDLRRVCRRQEGHPDIRTGAILSHVPVTTEVLKTFALNLQKPVTFCNLWWHNVCNGAHVDARFTSVMLLSEQRLAAPVVQS